MCAHRHQTAAGAVAFLNYLNGPAGSQGDWIGLDMFTGSTKELTPLANIRLNYDINLNILNLWQPDTSTLGVVQGLWGGPSPPPPPQTKGIAVCSKSNDPSPNGFVGPPALPAVPGGYRQCPSVSAVGVLPTAQQYAFPNHGWVQYCSAGGPPGLFAGTDLATALRDGAAKLETRSPGTYEPKALVLIADGTPMACTGIGGGSLCGHTYADDGVTPPSPKLPGDYWDPCCANGNSTCRQVTTSHLGFSYGGGASGDGNPANSPNGQAACDAAQQLVANAIDEANNAAAASIDVFTIGFFSKLTGRSQSFLSSLVRGNGTGIITTDSTQIGALLKNVPQHLPVSLVH